MIQVTRFNHTELYINADLIEFVESTPDTVISMVSGRKVLVLETPEEVRRKILVYRQEVGPLLLRAGLVQPETEQEEKDETVTSPR
ncbi:flagellar FlbD family protein [Chthonomonas calidirosea]|uniref:flagellar FlbD family protein n=1 Tax=Chthonomonas calidirosea TaxID=454171 RepID=UPI0006EC603F|nr:flagellar FlbD family protein [Chthonomonas calidirosea]CEK17871.1 uncharacterized protein, possibly involved in motility [Chthonomonas calidirosea]